MRILGVIAVVACVSCASCSSSPDLKHSQLLAKYGPQIEALRQTLVDLHATIPKTEPPALPKAFDPPIRYVYSKYAGAGASKVAPSNLEFIEHNRLKEPKPYSTSAFWPNGDLLHALDTSTKPSPDEPLGRGTYASLEEAYQNALATKYLGVIEIREWVTPRITMAKDARLTAAGEAAGSYTPGRMTMRVSIVELPSKRVLGAVEDTGETPDNVRFSYKWDDPTSIAPSAMASLEATMRDQLKKRLEAKLKAIGSFQFQ